MIWISKLEYGFAKMMFYVRFFKTWLFHSIGEEKIRKCCFVSNFEETLLYVLEQGFDG